MKNINKSLAREAAQRRTQASRTVVPSVPKSISYDNESGVVYDEVRVAGNRASSSWISDFKTPAIVCTRRRPSSGTGAKSLSDMVLEKLGLESQDLTVEVLEALPWTLGEKVWDRIGENHAKSLYIWRTFAIAYGQDFATPAHRYMLDIKVPGLSIPEYYSGLRSNDLEWLTCLRVSPKQLSVPDLVSVSIVTNLTVLDLSDGQLYMETRDSTFDLRVMKTWADQTRTGRAFKHLRVFMLGWQEKVEPWIFELLQHFPRLNTLIMTDCHWIHHKNHKEWEELAWKFGWEFMPSKRGVKHLRELLDDRSFGSGCVSNMHYESLRMVENNDKAIVPARRRPLLECWLGTPRVWKHIIEEFPGTRTVYLQRQRNLSSSASKQTPAKQSSSKREPSSPVPAADPKRRQNPMATRRKALQHNVASLLAEIGH